MSKQTIYLAIPYTGLDFEECFKTVNKIAADLMQKGYRVFSPITQGHPISFYLSENLKNNGKFWLDQELQFMKVCDKLTIVSIGKNGRDLIANSKGCQVEIKEARKLNLPIELYYYE